MIVFFFNDTATTEIYTLSLHDALPIARAPAPRAGGPARGHPAAEPRPRGQRRRGLSREDHPATAAMARRRDDRLLRGRPAGLGVPLRGQPHAGPGDRKSVV